jgi:hypothetical protein
VNHYRYRSTSAKFLPIGDAPNPVEPPGGGWELVGQCALAIYNTGAWVIWSWRQVSFVTPGEFTDQFQPHPPTESSKSE